METDQPKGQRSSADYTNTTPTQHVAEDRNDIKSQREISDSNRSVTFSVKNDEPYDVILVTGDKRFYCHKNVLSQHSLFFKAMFASGMKESWSNEVQLENVNSEHLRKLLDYFYSSYIDLTEENVQSMAELGCQFQVNSIINECCQLLLMMIDDDICLSLVRWSNMLMLSEVYNQSRKHALWHFSTVSQTEDFVATPCSQLINYLQDPHLNVDNEVDVFKAAAEWLRAQGKPHAVTDLVDFFSQAVNFHLMSDEEVASLMDLPVVTSDEAVSSFVASFTPEVITELRAKNPDRIRSSPRNGRILCVGAHHCALSHCCGQCPVARGERAPLEVLEFEPSDCSLKPCASLSDNYPALALDAGYRVSAIGHLIYIVGGKSSLGKSGDWLTTIWCLDTLHQSWHEAGSLQHVRRHHGMCAYGSILCLIGGIGRFRIRLQSVETYDTVSRQWNQLPDMLHQETSPAVTEHMGKIYVFKNYAQVFNIAANSWSFLEFIVPVPGLPLNAHHDPDTNGIFISCFNSESLWLIDLDRCRSQLVVNFMNQGWGGVFHRRRYFHFQLHEFGHSSIVQVECFNTVDLKHSIIGELQDAVLTSHFFTVPHFPIYTPSSSNQQY